MGADPAERFRLALDLFETGVALMRRRLVRLHPDWPPVRVEEAMARWLHERPGAASGDGEGRPVELERAT
jgi:hypothetical protein